jgi:DNA-3-methyladenine glycosylase II
VTTIHVLFESPFRFDLALRYLQRSPDEVIDLVREDRHARIISTSAGLALLEFRAGMGQAGTVLEARLIAGNADENEIRAALQRLYPAQVARADAEPEEPLARSLRAEFRGLPVIQTLTPWEALVWAIIGQQINIAFAYRLKRAFVESFGAALLHASRPYYAFPTPERVAGLEHERDLRPIQFSRQKSRYIIEAARSVMDGSLDFAQIGAMDDDAATLALQRQLGVGLWTAEYILLRGFGRLDVIPAGDAALKASVGAHLQLGRSATEAEVRALAEHWKPWRGETAFMLWFARQTGFLDG